MRKSRRPKSTDFNFRRLRSNLARHPTAMARLAALGIEPELAEAVGLGIKEPYLRADGREVHGVLAYPLENSGGRRRYAYLNVAGVTVGADHPVAWGPGSPATIRSGVGGTVIVMGSPIEVWQIGAAAGRLGLEVVAIGCSQPGHMPDDWRCSEFWARWDRVILADGVPPALASRITEVARRPIETAHGVQVAGATVDVHIRRRHEEWLEEMLETAQIVGRRSVSLSDPASEGLGDFAAATITMHGGFARGYLFHPFLVERRRLGVGGERTVLHSYETLVLRSDGAILEPRILPAPAGTPSDRRVHALSDGTRISAPPQMSRQSTWSLDAIQRYASDCAAGTDPCHRKPAELFEDVRTFLQSRVSLPQPDDLMIVAAFVFMTHLFRVFDAIPLIVVQGPRGSGKSELASAVVALSSNAAIMGQGSAAAIIRMTRECGGLIALDDAEGLSTSASGYGELGQCLKLSYKASTARKPIALGSGRIDTIDFFGPRLITTTRGVDPVLGSRCIGIRTLPAASVSPPDAIDDLAFLRDELHALGMHRATEVATVYAELAATIEDRHDEIWAPLRAIAKIVEDGRLTLAVARRSGDRTNVGITAAA